MHQAPASLWNQVAKTQNLRTAWAKDLFPLNQEALDKELDLQLEQLQAAGHPVKVALAYQLALPLVLERDALQAFVAEQGNLDLKAVFPETNNPVEAARLGALEYDLNELQRENLLALLRPLYRNR